SPTPPPTCIYTLSLHDALPILFLAHRSATAIDRTLAMPLDALTDQTVTDPAAIRERLRTVALAGYAWVHDEFAMGISSVAAEIRSEEHTSELQSRSDLVCRLLL